VILESFSKEFLCVFERGFIALAYHSAMSYLPVRAVSVALIAFLVGVGIETIAGLNVSTIITVSLVLVGIIGVFRWGGALLHNHVSLLGLRYGGIVFLGIVAGAFGMMRMWWWQDSEDATVRRLAPYERQHITGVGVIADEPIYKENTVSVIVRLSGGLCDQCKVIMSVKPNERYWYGERISFSGSLERVRDVISLYDDNEADYWYGYASYLSLDDIYYSIQYPKIKFISNGDSFSLKKIALYVKDQLDNRIDYLFHGQYVGIVKGILFGEKKAMGKELEQEFRDAGVIHVVILSGFSIALIASYLLIFFQSIAFVPRMATYALVMVALACFSLMTGGSAMVVRASIMGSIAMIAAAFHREYHGMTALLFTLFCMTLYQPVILLKDVAFQISILSVVGLMYVSPMVGVACEWVLRNVTNRFHLQSIMRHALVSTVATQLFVTPFLLLVMGDVSLVSVPVNLLVLPLLPLMIGSSFFVACIALISTTAAHLFVLFPYVLLLYLYHIVHYASHLPFATVAVQSMPMTVVGIWYLLYTLLIIWWKRRQRSDPL
jgi:ComEC/Rec2-related protein